MRFIFPLKSAPLKASAVVMELCFLVNNDSFHCRTAFSPVAEIFEAEGKENERGGVVLLHKAALSTLSSNMKSSVCPIQALRLFITADKVCSLVTSMIQNDLVCFERIYNKKTDG